MGLLRFLSGGECLNWNAYAFQLRVLKMGVLGWGLGE